MLNDHLSHLINKIGVYYFENKLGGAIQFSFNEENRVCVLEGDFKGLIYILIHILGVARRDNNYHKHFYGLELLDPSSDLSVFKHSDKWYKENLKNTE